MKNSQSSNKLPIENDSELLLEYGRVFAWINLIEFLLEELIIFKGKLNLIDGGLRKKLLERKMFGQKIELADRLLEPEIIKKLKTLNKKRILLAHNITAQEVKISNGEQREGEYVIGQGNKKEILTKEFLLEITTLAQSLSIKLHRSFIDGMGYKK